ncbi:MAG: glycosyltransferase [Pseudomonadota bacterium]|nr:MAG: glycosyltransferase [Pseudomonadota bacterium]
MSTDVRALLFAPVLGGGGAEARVVRLANELPKQGVETLLAVARGGGAYEERLRTGASPVTCQNLTRSSTLSLPLSFPKLVATIDRHEPDVVAALQGHVGAVLVAAARRARRRPRVVLGVPVNFSQRLAATGGWLERRLVDAERWAYRAADHVIAISKGVAEDLAQALPSVREKLSIVYNGVFDDTLTALAAQPLPLERPRERLIVACGRLVPQKDYPTLLRALSLVKTRPSPVLWILGEGPERDAIVRLAHELRIRERVVLLGFQKNPFPFMACADVFVTSSRYEGFSNAMVEAMACGTRVVATDCPSGPAEILDWGKFGALVPVGDAPALARAVDDVLRSEHGDESRARLRERAAMFSSAASARGYARIFRTVGGWQKHQSQGE